MLVNQKIAPLWPISVNMLSMNIMEHLMLRPEKLSRRRQVVQSFKAKADAKRSPAEKFADWMTAHFGSVAFLTVNAILFLSWITINTGRVPGIEPFDPFPFGLLTTIVSLEAIFLAIIVLISQNREAKIADLREEVDLQINVMAEEEVSKIVELLVKVLEKHGVKVGDDPEIKKMIKPSASAEIERKVEEELNAEDS